MRIEEGKFYRQRDGGKIGPVIFFPRGSLWTVVPGELSGNDWKSIWHVDGKNFGDDDNLDLIAEWTDEPPANGSHEPAERTDPCAPLWRVLDEAYDQASKGKGALRHANGKPFLEQPVMEIGRMVGPGFHLGQVMKKAQEAMGMIERGEMDAARAELCGIIIYAAADVLLIEEKGMGSRG